MADIPARELRLKIIDSLLKERNGNYTFNDILKIVNDKLEKIGSQVGVRQLRKDFETIRKVYGVRIRKKPGNGHAVFYEYENLNAEIYRNELSDEELTQLRSTIDMMSRFRGSRENAWLEDVITSLEMKFGVRANPENLVGFESYDNLKGIEHLSAVIDATLNHIPLGIDYKPYDLDAENWLVYPYYVKQFNGRWFMFGWVEEENALYNLALDRIQKIVPYDFEFKPNDVADFNTYFDDIIGVTRPNRRNAEGENEEVPPVTITMQFSEKRFPYAKTKKMHKSFEVISEEDCIAKITVRPNNEFYARVLEYGSDIEILSPDSVRKEIKKKVEIMYKKYFDVH